MRCQIVFGWEKIHLNPPDRALSNMSSEMSPLGAPPAISKALVHPDATASMRSALVP